jgi:hypothetical protein
MPFCPACGLDLTKANGMDQAAPHQAPADLAASDEAASDEAASDQAAENPSPSGRLRIPPLAVVIVIVLVGLVVLGLVPRLPFGTSPPPAGQATANPGGGVVAPIVGLTILSPTDGQAVATKEVVVIGTAPPGLSITQDISLGLDQHTSVDGTGHWALKVGLKDGDNKLTFRIGDDHSTERTIRVIYTPPASS